MSRWLAPVEAALDARTSPLAVFLRDDDAGWRDDRLERLLRVCAEVALPLDVAVIPAAVTAECAEMLLRWRERRPARVRLHQHGLAHENHEAVGRKSEFGASRTAAQQVADLAEGARRLNEWFGAAVDSIFTPPWNRCTEATALGLRQLGFDVLSRDSTAPRVDLLGLLECPTHLDWFAKRHGTRVTPDDWAQTAARAMSGPGPIGLLLHHAVMDDEEFDRLAPLLRLVATHPACVPCSLIDAARSPFESPLTLRPKPSPEVPC